MGCYNVRVRTKLKSENFIRDILESSLIRRFTINQIMDCFDTNARGTCLEKDGAKKNEVFQAIYSKIYDDANPYNLIMRDFFFLDDQDLLNEPKFYLFAYTLSLTNEEDAEPKAVSLFNFLKVMNLDTMEGVRKFLDLFFRVNLVEYSRLIEKKLKKLYEDSAKSEIEINFEGVKINSAFLEEMSSINKSYFNESNMMKYFEFKLDSMFPKNCEKECISLDFKLAKEVNYNCIHLREEYMRFCDSQVTVKNQNT